jgi:hypothetical protein
VLFVATMGNTVYAFDADDPARAEPYWSKNLGTPAPGDSWIGPVYHGILSTPFIDVPTGTVRTANPIWGRRRRRIPAANQMFGLSFPRTIEKHEKSTLRLGEQGSLVESGSEN